MNQKKVAVIVSILIVLTGYVDTRFDLLQDAGLSLITINRIKLTGLVLSAILPIVTPLLLKKEK